MLGSLYLQENNLILENIFRAIVELIYYWFRCIGSSQRKNVAATLDSSDTDSASSTSTLRSDPMLLSGGFDLQLEKDSVLDQALDDLYEKRYSLRPSELYTLGDGDAARTLMLP